MEKEFNKIDRETLKNISKELDLEHSKKKEFNLSEKRLDTFSGYKYSEKAVKEFIKMLNENDKDFLNTILKSNKGRDDCLIHMVKGRLKSNWIKKLAGKELVEEKE